MIFCGVFFPAWRDSMQNAILLRNMFELHQVGKTFKIEFVLQLCKAASVTNAINFAPSIASG